MHVMSNCPINWAKRPPLIFTCGLFNLIRSMWPVWTQTHLNISRAKIRRHWQRHYMPIPTKQAKNSRSVFQTNSQKFCVQCRVHGRGQPHAYCAKRKAHLQTQAWVWLYKKWPLALVRGKAVLVFCNWLMAIRAKSASWDAMPAKVRGATHWNNIARHCSSRMIRAVPHLRIASLKFSQNWLNRPN